MKSLPRSGQFALATAWVLFVGYLGWRLARIGLKYAAGNFPTNFGDTLLTNQIWFVAHMLCGIAVLFLGPLQFLPAVRERFVRYHRVAGKIYIVASFISIAALLINIIPDGECTACRPSNYVVTVLWLLSVVAAWMSIRVYDTETHRAFMIRGYIFAAYFILVRTYGDAMMRFLPGEPGDAGQWANSDWLTWMIPLILLEIYLFASRYLRHRRVVT